MNVDVGEILHVIYVLGFQIHPKVCLRLIISRDKLPNPPTRPNERANLIIPNCGVLVGTRHVWGRVWLLQAMGGKQPAKWPSYKRLKTAACMFPRLYHHSRRKNRTVAEALANETWIAHLMHSITPDILAEYVMLWLVIDAAGFDPTNQRQDEIIWTRSASDEYSARSAYQMQFQGSITTNFDSLIWRIWAPSWCKFFTWLMIQNRVWTADRLLLREWPNEYFCPLCRPISKPLAT
jgi:hypothetical protein